MSRWRLRLRHQVTGGTLQSAALLIVAAVAAAGMCGEAGDGVVCVGVGGATVATFAVAAAVAVGAPSIAAAAVAAGCDGAVHRVAAVL